MRSRRRRSDRAGTESGNAAGISSRASRRENKAAGGRGGFPRKSGERKFDGKLFAVSAAAGIAATFACMKVYRELIGGTYGPLVIAACFALYAVIMSVAVLLFAGIDGRYPVRKRKSEIFLPALLFLVAVTAAAFLFELIYEIGGGLKAGPATSYIFLLDDSGSMEENDPSFERYTAVSSIMDSMDAAFPFAVYSYSDDVILIRELGAKGDLQERFAMPAEQSMGGTATVSSLKHLLDEIRGNAALAGDSPKVLLLSDGYATDKWESGGIGKLLRTYAQNGISISAVGLGSNVDTSFMERVAKETGGVYMNVSEIGSLSQVMNQAIQSRSKRNLLSYRTASDSFWLYFFERVLFMGLLGAAIGLSLSYFAEIKEAGTAMLIGIVKGVLAGLALELMINTLYFGESFADVLYFMLVALIFATEVFGNRRGALGEGGADRPENMTGDPAIANDFGKDNRKKKSDGIRTLGRGGRRR